jgi:hypothetical protein
MSDTTTNPTPDTEAPAQEAPKPEAPEIDWKAKAREWEKRAKDNKSAADRLAEIEEASKSEAQKAADRLAAAERKAVEAEARVLRRDIALDFKLGKEDAELLDSITDEDAMRRLAERLVGRESERKKQGNHVPNEGRTPNPADDTERAAVRGLFGSD